MKKKILLGLGAITSVIVPVAAVVACGEDPADDIELDLRGKNGNSEAVDKLTDEFVQKVGDEFDKKNSIKVIIKTDSGNSTFKMTNEETPANAKTQEEIEEIWREVKKAKGNQ